MGRPHPDRFSMDLERIGRGSVICKRRMIFRDPAAAHRRLAIMFPKWKFPTSPEAAALSMLEIIMAHPAISSETKMKYFMLIPPEAYALRPK